MNRREFLVSGGALASKLADEYGIEFAILIE